MRKHMNNHFGYSRIFKLARFASEDGSENTDLQDIGASGGSSSNDDESGDDVDSLKEEIARLKGENAKFKNDNERFKNSITKLTKQNGELTKKQRAMTNADQLEKEAQEERDKRFAEMEKELRTSKYSKRLVGIGMKETDADTFAEIIPELEDADKFFNSLSDFIKSREKIAADNKLQEILKSRPDIHAGNETDKDDPAMALAKKSVENLKGNSFSVNQDILKNFI